MHQISHQRGRISADVKARFSAGSDIHSVTRIENQGEEDGVSLPDFVVIAAVEHVLLDLALIEVNVDVALPRSLVVEPEVGGEDEPVDPADRGRELTVAHRVVGVKISLGIGQTSPFRVVFGPFAARCLDIKFDLTVSVVDEGVADCLNVLNVFCDAVRVFLDPVCVVSDAFDVDLDVTLVVVDNLSVAVNDASVFRHVGLMLNKCLIVTCKFFVVGGENGVDVGQVDAELVDVVFDATLVDPQAGQVVPVTLQGSLDDHDVALNVFGVPKLFHFFLQDRNFFQKVFDDFFETIFGLDIDFSVNETRYKNKGKKGQTEKCFSKHNDR